MLTEKKKEYVKNLLMQRLDELLVEGNKTRLITIESK
jgi:hypothetical protein